MSSILSSWRKSLSVFLPRHFKLFLLAVANAALQGVRPYVLYGFPFIGAWLGYEIVGSFYPFIYGYSILQLVGIAVFALTYVLMVPAVRPSVGMKNCAYFRAFWLHIGIGAALLIIYTFAVSISSFLAIISFIAALFPLVITILFFLFDSKDPMRECGRSMIRGILFTLYNYPFYLITVIGGFLVTLPFLLLNALIFTYVFHLWWLIIIIKPLLSLLLIYLMVCWLNVFYTKRVYELYDTYA